MFEMLDQARRSTFVRHNAIFFFGSVAVGALNYLYYPILGRLLEPAVFGEVQALVSIFLQLTIFLNVLSMITVNIVSNYDDSQKANKVVSELEKLALLLSMALVVVVVIGMQPLQHFFKFESGLPFVALALAFVVSVPLAFRTAYVRARQKFGAASAINLFGAVGKLIASVALVLIGWGTLGAIGGIIAAQGLAFGFAAWHAARLGFERPPDSPRLHRVDLGVVRPELKYAALVFVGTMVITLFYSIDIIVVKHYFDAHTAGLYAGIATVARIIFFLTMSISQVMMPAIQLKQSARANRGVLVKSLALNGVIGGVALAVFVLAPRLVIEILMGEKYLEYANLLPGLGVAIFIISILNLFVTYYIALRRYIIAIIGIMSAGVAFGLMLVHHQTLQAVVESLLLGSIAMVCLLGISVGVNKLKRRTSDDAEIHIDNSTRL